MKKPWLIIGGVLVAMCCLSSMCLAALGSDAAFNGAAKQLAAGQTDAQLVGEWSSTSTSLVGYRDLATGSWAPPSGNSISVELRDDGSCVQAAMMQSSLYSCTSYLFAYIDDCAWSVDGSTVTLELGDGESRTKMCGGEEKRGKTVPGPHVFQFGQDDGKPVLRDGTMTLRRTR